MAEHLLGGGVVQAVALAAHGLADAEAFEQVMHVIARLAPVRAVPPPRVPGADGASQSHAPHDHGHALGRHSLPELVDQAHAHLPVAAPVRRTPARAWVRASVWISPPLGLGPSASGPPARHSRHQRSRGATLAIPCMAMTSVLVMPFSTWSRAAATFVSPTYTV